MHVSRPLILLASLLVAGCVQRWEEHVCNDEQIVHLLRAPGPHAPISIHVQYAGMSFSGFESPLVVTARYFDSHGPCAIPSDRLTVTWGRRSPEDELPLIPSGSQALFRPTHPGIYNVVVTVEHSPIEARTEWLRLPVISHEQNAILHLKALLDHVYGFNYHSRKGGLPPPPELVQASNPLRGAYSGLDTGNLIEATRQLEIFRTQVVSRHKSEPSWAGIVSETDNAVEGMRNNDHRFDSLPYESSTWLW